MDLMQSIIYQQAKQMSRQREEKIIKILNDKGYNIDVNNRLELENFLKTRCEIRIFEDCEMEVLHVDGSPICAWSTKTDCKFEGNTITMTIGDVVPV